MTKRTGRLALPIIVAGACAGLITGCSATISGKPTANADELAAYQEEIAAEEATEANTTACTDFRDGYIQIVRAINDFVDAYNTEGGYTGPTVGSKITTATETIDKWTGVVAGDLVPAVDEDVRTTVDTWKQSALAVRDSLDKREDDTVVNDRSTELNDAKEAALAACAAY